MRDYSHPIPSKPRSKRRLNENRRSPPVLFSGTGITVLTVFHLSARREVMREEQQRCEECPNPAYSPYGSAHC